MNRPQTAAPLVLGPALNGILMTPREFDAVEDCEEDYVYELINGVLIVVPPPAEGERDPNEELGYLLRLYREQHPSGTALDATLSEQRVITPRSRRRADRVIWVGLGRQPDPEQDMPSIVVEFVSKGKRNYQRDYLLKRRDYLKLGVVEYWLIDRFRRILTVYRKGVPDLVVAEKDVYRTRLLPGFELPLARLLTAADRWPARKKKR
jgi:Uma2 family endonuclease